jgi:hypothetical protein
MSGFFCRDLAISLIGNICYLPPHNYLAMLMPPLLQIMASLIREGLVWVFLLLRFSRPTTFISGLLYRKLIVSYMLSLQP